MASDKQKEVTGPVASDKQKAVTGSVASDEWEEVTGSVMSDKWEDVTVSVASDNLQEVTCSVASDKQVEVTGSVTSNKQVEVTGYVASDKQEGVTGFVASDKQVEVICSVASDEWEEMICSVASDKHKEVTGSVASDEWEEMTGSVASNKWEEVTGSVASDEWEEVTSSVVSDEWEEVTGSVAANKQVEVTGAAASNKQVQVRSYVVPGEHVEAISSVASKQVELPSSAASDKQLKEVGRIRLWGIGHVYGMVVYRQKVYVVHYRGLVVYCYTPDGLLSHRYKHKCGADISVFGMCLMMDGDSAMMVVSDGLYDALVWIKISDSGAMKYHHTQQLNYSPCGLYNDEGDLLVCNDDNHTITRYSHDAQTLAVINLPDNVMPWWVARHGDSDQYVVSDFCYLQVVIIDNEGHTKTCYENERQSLKHGWSRHVITDPHRGVLIADYNHNQVRLLRTTGDVVKLLDQHVRSPRILYLDNDHHRLYVCSAAHVFIFNYDLLNDAEEL